MYWMKLRPGRPVLLGVTAAAVMLLGACGSSPASSGGTGLTGTEDREMHTFFSANGFNYTTNSTAPAGFTPASAAG
jgi:hypothetical protein